MQAFSLQDMVRQTLAEADQREKIAQAAEEPESKKDKKSGPPASPQAPAENSSTAPERNDEPLEEKTSSVFVEKLAGALDFCNEHFLKEAVGKPEPPKSHTPPTAATNIGAGKGTGAVETDVDTPPGGGGMQSEQTGQARTGQIPTNPGSDPKSPGQTNPSTAMETDINSPPGGSEDWSKGSDKMKQAMVDRVKSVMTKMGENALNPAKVGAKVTNPHQSSPEGAAPAEEGVPSQPGETSKQEKLVSSLAKAISYTKKDAKAVPKKRMGEVLTEPAQKKSTDPVLQNNLSAASSAGVKIASMQAAAARVLLEKIAEEGARPDASPEAKERAAKLQEALTAKEAAQQSSAGMPVGGGY